MRIVAAIAVIVQLLLRGVAVTHCHAQDGRGEPANHAHRPHIHLAGKSYAASHRHTKHEHSHRHTPVTPQPADPSPFSSEHDRDAVYLSIESVIRSTDRIQLPEPTEASWVLAEFEVEGVSGLIAGRAIGPPSQSPDTHLDLLPHLLRI